MLNDQQQTKKMFADGWTMIKGCSTDYSKTDSTEKKLGHQWRKTTSITLPDGHKIGRTIIDSCSTDY